jgi:hypothetical protein
VTDRVEEGKFKTLEECMRRALALKTKEEAVKSGAVSFRFNKDA